MAESGTMSVVLAASAWPVEAVRRPGLAEVVVEVPVLASVVLASELTVVAPLEVVLVVSVEGTYRSFSTTGARW
ncbi:hypothetical protein D9M68_981910 [compost metagenome]